MVLFEKHIKACEKAESSRRGTSKVEDEKREIQEKIDECMKNLSDLTMKQKELENIVTSTLSKNVEKGKKRKKPGHLSEESE